MNIGQVMRQALLEANVVLRNSTSTPLITEAELIQWAQFAVWELEKVHRAAKADHAIRTVNSTDVAFTWDNILFDPTTMDLIEGTNTYTLPPDVLVMRRIRGLDDAGDDRPYEQLDFSHPTFQMLQEQDSPNTDIVYYDIIGDRTLIVANPPTTDIEIMYVPRSRKLRLYSTGTVTATLADATIEGASSPNWILNGLAVPMELMISTGVANTLVVLSQTSTDIFLDPHGETVRAYPVLSFTDLDTLELAADFPLATVTGRGYILASSPQLLKDHANVVVRYMVHKIWSKVGNPGAKSEYILFQEEKNRVKEDIQERSSSPEFVQDFDP